MTDCVCESAGWCERHQCEKTRHWHRLCQTRLDYFQLWEEHRGPGQDTDQYLTDMQPQTPPGPEPNPNPKPVRIRRSNLPAKRGRFAQFRRPARHRRHRNGTTLETPSPTVAVVVVCHNYGRFLGECLDSVLGQSQTADEILVVDDRSTDNSMDVAKSFESRRVRYLRVDHGNVHRTRESGFRATESEFVCFLDADDRLGSEYLKSGLAQFHGAETTAIVYSDVELFGQRTGQSNYPATFDRAQFERDNYIHAGSLVRREAIEQSRAFRHHIDPLTTQADWFLWQRVLETGWIACKQTALYEYRQHGSNWMEQMGRQPKSWYDYAGIGYEKITLFLALSGRRRLWNETASYLERQTWPRNQMRLVLMDTSQDESFGVLVKEWLVKSGYRDIRYFAEDVAEPGLADQDRRLPEVQRKVRLAVARVYNRLVDEAHTGFVWVLEDDIVPPDDACERLLRRFDAQTGSVAGVYCSRYSGQACVWDENRRPFPQRRNGVQQVAGNGFGCVVLRSGALRGVIFRAPDDFDRTFYQQLGANGLKALVDWSVQCRHWNSEDAPVSDQ